MMDRATLGPREALYVPYTAPFSGIVMVRVLATDPVNAYVVDAAGREAYEQGDRDFMPVAASRNRAEHLLTASIPPGTRWHLIIANPAKSRIVDVQYDVQSGGPVEDGYGGGILSGSIFGRRR